MKIEVEVLGCTDICFGCKRVIGKDEKVYMISELLEVRGAIQLCDDCISELSFKGIKLTNINLTGITVLEQIDKVREEEKEFAVAIELADKENAIEEFFDCIQSKLGLLEKVFSMSADEAMKEYPKHLEKIKNRPRSKLKNNNNYDNAED